MTVDLASLFAANHQRGWLCVLEIDGDGEFSSGADDEVIGASTFKLAVALELYCRAAGHELDLDQRVAFRAERSDSIESSLGEAAWMMMAVSDNAAADALIDRLGADAINARLRRCGLTRTVVRRGVQLEVQAIASELQPYAVAAGFEGWFDLAAGHGGDVDVPARRLRQITVPDDVPSAGRGAPTTPRDMARLVRAIWRDEAGPPAACAQVRELMSHQLVQRLALAFPDRTGVRVAANGGRIPGLVRNDVGAICLPDGRYAAAVFTRADYPFAGDQHLDVTIGQAAALAIQHLRR
jgi:beta-lactamase class A